MTPELLALKIRKARGLANMSQQETASALSIPRTAISQIEAGKRSVSTLELTKLANLYHIPITYFFEEDSEPEEDILCTLYRAAPSIDTNDEVKRQVDRYIQWCREGHHLERLLGKKHYLEPPSYRLDLPNNTLEAVSQGEQIAEQERKRLGLGIAPIADIPDLISKQNIWVYAVELPETISGVFLNHPDIGLTIFTNAKHAYRRKRFSYAHEYAHALLDSTFKITISSGDNIADYIEQRANAFAASFLMPDEGVKRALHHVNNHQLITYQDIALLSEHFGVSYQAAIYRLKHLRYLSNKRCKEMLAREDEAKQFLKILGLNEFLDVTTDSLSNTKELRNHIMCLAIEAYRKEEISYGKFIDLGNTLAIPPDQVLGLVQQS